MSEDLLGQDVVADDHRRVALRLEYSGVPYCGWQRQASPPLPTVQDVLETALSQVADHPVSLICAGRTDRGVHATAQVVHFDSRSDRDDRAWVRGGNSLLPRTIRIHDARQVPTEFHARFSALARRYLYLIDNRAQASAILHGHITPFRPPLNVSAMHESAQYLLGENDFSTFQAAGCQSSSPFRCVHHLNVREQGAFIVVDIQANAFLQHMVRNIVGALLSIGQGLNTADWMEELLKLRDRRQAPATASPAGLYLVQVVYPEIYGLKPGGIGPAFIQPCE